MADQIRGPSGRYLPNKDWHPVSSSNVKYAAYDPDSGELLVVLNGGTYAYVGVPEDALQELLSADSAGRYLNENIKSVYPFRKM